MPSQSRIERIQDMLRQQDLAALVCSRPPNVLAFTGYWPVVGNSIAIVTREGATGLLVPEDEKDLTANSIAATIESYEPATLSAITPLTEAIHGPLSNLLTTLNCKQGPFAHDAGPSTEPATYAATFHFGTALPALLPGGTQDLSPFLACLRAVLTEQELASVRTACEGAKAGFQRAKQQLRPGVTERDIAIALSAEISKASAHPRAIAFGFCMSGPNSANAYRAYQLPSNRALQSPDIALLHVNSCNDGFWTDITRTYAIEASPPLFEAVQKAIAEATQAALEAIKPGAQARDVDAAARSVMERAGYGKQFKHATGHGVGFAAIDHNARPLIHPKSTDVLEPGMVFNIEPAAYLEGEFGARQCSMVAVTATGCELLTDFDRCIV